MACAVTFLYRVRPLKFARVIRMLEASLSQLEHLVGDLVQQNQNLQNTNAQLTAELAKVRDENDSLQLSLMEQEEKQGSTAARIQALVDRATSASAVEA
ncbi:ATPase involved in DNA repair [Pseudomonas viridiflava]|nr:ATPase involved in DNA repair [Pseudomonas viridiflava]